MQKVDVEFVLGSTRRAFSSPSNGKKDSPLTRRQAQNQAMQSNPTRGRQS